MIFLHFIPFMTNSNYSMKYLFTKAGHTCQVQGETSAPASTHTRTSWVCPAQRLFSQHFSHFSVFLTSQSHIHLMLVSSSWQTQPTMR